MEKCSILSRVLRVFLIFWVGVTPWLVPSLSKAEVIPTVTDRPGGTSPGGRRGADHLPMILLPPNRIGLTTLTQPTLFFYVPEQGIQQVSFVLQDPEGQILYQTPLQLPKGPALLELNLAKRADFPGLQPGQPYRWSVVVPKVGDRPTNTIPGGTRAPGEFVQEKTEGIIYRIEPPSSLVAKLTIAPVGDRPRLYTEAGIWHEALAAIVELRQMTPEDEMLRKTWIDLLKSFKVNSNGVNFSAILLYSL